MSTAMTPLMLHRSRIAVVIAAVTVIVSACASTGTREKTPAQIDIQDTIGFTITEDAKISSGVRLDYEQAIMYLERDNRNQGIELLESVAGAAPNLSAPRIDLGVAYHDAGNLEAAEKNLLLALETNPDHPIALNELGIIYRKTGRFMAARKSYEAAIAVYPGYHFARRNLAVLCDLYLADFECALQNYEAYMATVPSDDEASMWIKDLQYRMSQSEAR